VRFKESFAVADQVRDRSAKLLAVLHMAWDGDFASNGDDVLGFGDGANEDTNEKYYGKNTTYPTPRVVGDLFEDAALRSHSKPPVAGLLDLPPNDRGLM
jgi:hypothetical protein